MDIYRFEQLISRFIAEESLLVAGDRVLVACSGGVDSVALLQFMVTNSAALGIQVAAVHVDHMLRGEESAADGVLVEELCTSYGIPFFGGAVPVLELIAQDGGNKQAVCREGRYAYFNEVMEENNFTKLVTAHHAEDQLETVLMQLAKGYKPFGMPTRREMTVGELIRPFLPAMKADLQAYVKEKGLPFREDPSNESDVYMRNRFRHHVIPFILKENHAAAENIVKISSMLRDDDDLLVALAQEQFKQIVQYTKEGLPLIDSNRFTSMHSALQRRVIQLLLKYLYEGENATVKYNFALIEQLVQHLSSDEGNVSIDLPHGYRVKREYGMLFFVRNTSTDESPEQVCLPEGVPVLWNQDVWLYWSKVDAVNAEMGIDADEIMYFDASDEAFPFYVRSRREGDRIKLPGMEQPKRLSRLFIDEKVGMSKRDRCPILTTADGDICALPGLRYGKLFSRSRLEREKYIFIMKKCNR